MKKSVAVIGQGFVGGSLTTVLAERGLDVYVFDKVGKVATGGKPLVQPLTIDPERMAQLAGLPVDQQSTSSTFETTIDGLTPLGSFVKQAECINGFSGIYFVCLPTPMFTDGSADVRIVEGVLEQLSKMKGTRIAVVKSTVPPGTTERWNRTFEGTGLRVVFNPEFLREATAVDDMRNQDRIVLGGPRPFINKVKQVFEFAFPNVPIVKTSSTTAEMVKYVTNVHLAVKVALANEFYQICEALDKRGANVDYDKVVEYATIDKRLGPSHWKVPGPMPADDTGEPAYGYGGSCFVKDINALISIAKQNGVDPKVMVAAWQKNVEVRPQRDWEKLVGRAVSATEGKNTK